MNYPLGFITKAQRTRDMELVHDDCMAKMPATRFSSPIRQYYAGEVAGPLLLWNRPEVVSALGFAYPGTHQLTGSCVGAGGGNACFSLSAVEVLRLNDPENIILPFWLYPYGISRWLLGDTTEGEGSLGSTFAQAVREHGVFSNAEPGLPKPRTDDGLIWGDKIELEWSNGKAKAGQWKDLAKKHPIKTTTNCTSGQQAFDLVMNWYPVTFACNNYISPGSEKLMGSGENQCVVGEVNQNGGHQTSLQLGWLHPELGPLVWNQNQWGVNVYKQDPKTGRKDGCWQRIANIDRALKSLDAEVFGFSQYDGYPAQQYVMVGEANILPRAA